MTRDWSTILPAAPGAVSYRARRLASRAAASSATRLLIAAALLALVGAGVPLLERWFKCLDATSEGCVWAKAYLPLSFALWTIVGAVVAAIAWRLLRGKGGDFARGPPRAQRRQ